MKEKTFGVVRPVWERHSWGEWQSLSEPEKGNGLGPTASPLSGHWLSAHQPSAVGHEDPFRRLGLSGRYMFG